MNQWLDHNIYGNICNSVGKLQDGRFICFTNLCVLKPFYEVGNKRYPLPPAFAKRELLTYSSELHVDMSIWNKEMTRIDFKSTSTARTSQSPRTLNQSRKTSLQTMYYKQ